MSEKPERATCPSQTSERSQPSTEKSGVHGTPPNKDDSARKVWLFGLILVAVVAAVRERGREPAAIPVLPARRINGSSLSASTRRARQPRAPPTPTRQPCDRTASAAAVAMPEQTANKRRCVPSSRRNVREGQQDRGRVCRGPGRSPPDCGAYTKARSRWPPSPRMHGGKRWCGERVRRLATMANGEDAEARSADRRPVWRNTAYHAQQAAEKAVKALIFHLGGPLNRTHDILELLLAVSDRGPGQERRHRVPSGVRHRWSAVDEFRRRAALPGGHHGYERAGQGSVGNSARHRG